MASEKREHDPFLAAVEAKIAAWTAVADSYRAAAALDGGLPIEPGASTGAAGQPRHPVTGKGMELPVGVFRDKSIKEAIAIYLGAGHRKQTNKEIAIGLQKGGIATTSVNFEATVATALHRMKEEGTILRFPDGWDLAASYPDNLRGRLEKDAKPRRKTATAKKAKRRRRTATAEVPERPKTGGIKFGSLKPASASALRHDDDDDLKATG